MKKLIVVGASAAALAVSAGAASASSTHHSCGNEGTAVGKITATNVGCSTARKVARADVKGKRYKKFKCSSTQYYGGANVTCHHGKQKVTFQVAD